MLTDGDFKILNITIVFYYSLKNSLQTYPKLFYNNNQNVNVAILEFVSESRYVRRIL